MIFNRCTLNSKFQVRKNKKSVICWLFITSNGIKGISSPLQNVFKTVQYVFPLGTGWFKLKT